MTNAAERPPRSWLGVAVFLYGTLFAAFVAFVVYRRQGLVEGTIDLNGFGVLSRSIAQGDGFSLGHGPTIRRAPLYPYFGAALLRLFGSGTAGLPDAELFRPLLIANCVIFGLTTTVVWRLTRELFGPRAALLAVAMCPFVPQSLRYVGMTEVETLMGLFTALMALTGFQLVVRPSIGRGLAFGASIAGATLSKPIVLLFPFVFLPLALLYWKRTGALQRASVLAAVSAFACFGLLLVPWSIRNSIVTNGQFKGISSNGPGEFLRGYINAQPKYFLLRQNFGGGGPGEKWDPEANDYEEKLLKPFGMPFYRSGKDAAGNAVTFPPQPPGVPGAQLELEKDRIESAEMKRRILHEPGGFLYKFSAQFASFWYVVETTKKSLMVGAVALIMLSFAGLGAFRAYKKGATVWPVLAVIIYFNAIYAAFLAFARYSMPLFPTLTVLAAGGLFSILEPLLSRWLPAKLRSSGSPLS